MENQLAGVLVIDDEPDLCWALETILDKKEYSVVSAANGAQALEQLETNEFVLALVDAKLPDVDGIELAKKITRRSPSTMVVLVSGYFYAQDRTIVEGLRNHTFADFIAKPFSLRQVRAVAKHALERRGNNGGNTK